MVAPVLPEASCFAVCIFTFLSSVYSKAEEGHPGQFEIVCDCSSHSPSVVAFFSPGSWHRLPYNLIDT